MRLIITALFTIVASLSSSGQNQQYLSEICNQISSLWRIDSNSCQGYRLNLVGLLTKAQPDSITKEFLFTTLGKPNRIQKFYKGYPDRKDYVEYIYYIYKDACPNIKTEGASIGFVFDETETYFIKLENHDYCG